MCLRHFLSIFFELYTKRCVGEPDNYVFNIREYNSRKKYLYLDIKVGKIDLLLSRKLQNKLFLANSGKWDTDILLARVEQLIKMELPSSCTNLLIIIITIQNVLKIYKKKNVKTCYIFILWNNYQYYTLLIIFKFLNNFMINNYLCSNDHTKSDYS